MADEAGRVGAGTTIRGAVRGSGPVVIEGAVEGELVLKDEAVVAPGGRIRGDLRARSADLSGRVEGSVETGELDIRAAARVGADVTASSATIEDGATVEGYLRMPLDLPSDLEGGA